MENKVNILTISGHDPSGGAGLQADIESINAMGGHPLSLVSCLTTQDSCNVVSINAVDAEILRQQAKVLLADMLITAIKIGLIPNHEVLEVIIDICREFPSLPIVVDPVLAAGGGKNIANQSLTEAIFQQLLPLTTVLTPNTLELQRLSGLEDFAKAVQLFADQGCAYTLVTGTHADTSAVINQLYYQGKLLQTLSWPRLLGEYHGSGCTLASALAALLGQGYESQLASKKAQQFAWDSLQAATIQGSCQHFPNRLLIK